MRTRRSEYLLVAFSVLLLLAQAHEARAVDCGSSTAPMCNGDCMAGETCTANDLGQCSCGPSCGGNGPSCTGNTCPAGQVCTATGTDPCTCQTRCDQGRAPTCGGACIPGETCTDNDLGECSCGPTCDGNGPSCDNTTCPPGQVCTATGTEPCSCRTATPTMTPTFTATPTRTPTATSTPTLVPNGGTCTDDSQCASGICRGGICVLGQSVPVLSGRNELVMAFSLLLAGLWSVWRLARRR